MEMRMKRYAEAEVIELDAASRRNPASLWKLAVEAIQERNGGSLDLWFQQIRDVKVEGTKIVIAVPNTFTREWIKDKYGPQLVRELKKLTSRNFDIQFAFTEAEEAAPRATRRRQTARATKIAPANPFGAPAVNERFTFDGFVEGSSNRLACEAARTIACQPQEAVSPVFIHGGTGLGKTHLLCAIYQARRQMGKAEGVIYISAESFLNQFIETLGSHTTRQFRDLYRKTCTTLLIDDIHFMSSKQKTQEEFFHCFNDLYSAGKQIVLTADRPPNQLERIDEGLRSRFEWGLVVDIQPPDFETRLAIIRRKARASGLELPDGIAVKIAELSRGSVREIEGIIIRLQMQSRIWKVPVSEALFREVAANFSPRTSVKVAIDDVIRQVASAYGLKISDIRGLRRHRTVALPRQVAMFICRESLGLSFPEIADRFGGKNHTTVIAACRKIRELVKKDLSLLSTIERLTNQLGLSPADAAAGAH
jgi:chromosomal replication initiator protein